MDEIKEIRERLARIEERLENVREDITEIKSMKEAVEKLERKVHLISAIVSGGLIVVWEFLKKKLGGEGL